MSTTTSPQQDPIMIPIDAETPVAAPTDAETPAAAPTDAETPAAAPTDAETPAAAPTDAETPAAAPTDAETPAAAPTDAAATAENDDNDEVEDTSAVSEIIDTHLVAVQQQHEELARKLRELGRKNHVHDLKRKLSDVTDQYKEQSTKLQKIQDGITDVKDKYDKLYMHYKNVEGQRNQLAQKSQQVVEEMHTAYKASFQLE